MTGQPLLGLALCGLLLTACKKEEAAPLPAPAVPAPALPAPAPPPVAAAPAAASAPAAPAASTDPDNPTILASKEIKGSGQQQKRSYYYAFKGGPGVIKLTATAKNAPAGMASALVFAIYDAKSNSLCGDSSGNTNTDKTIVLSCSVDKPQPLVLRLDLAEETIDYAVALDGPVELLAPQAAAAAAKVAGPGSTDIDAPTRLETNRVKGEGSQKAVTYYYAFNAGPGELTLTIDGKNRSAAMTEALIGGLYTLRSERVCEIALGNTTLDKRGVATCQFDKREPVILRLDLSADTIDFRARFDGPHDFEAFEPPKAVTIALDAAVLFDTGKAVLKPEAKKTLQEAAARVKKFSGAGVLISGHTDNVGKDASNMTLSNQRAAAVRDYFVQQEGVAPEGLTVKGFGKLQPVADNGSDAGRARNRRVDVVIAPR